jgi:hypothetical protein
MKKILNFHMSIFSENDILFIENTITDADVKKAIVEATEKINKKDYICEYELLEIIKEKLNALNMEEMKSKQFQFYYDKDGIKLLDELY